MKFHQDQKLFLIAIDKLNSGDVLIVAGKGHEDYQEFKNKKKFFSDKFEILKSISQKNKNLSKSIKNNILEEILNNKIVNKKNL